VALAALLKVSGQDSVIECGGVAALVGLLAPGWTSAVHEQAAAALRSVCADNTPNQDGVRECGGVAALVALLAPGGSAAVLEDASFVLAKLCLRNARNRDCVRECGGIPALVALSETAAAAKSVAGTFMNLTSAVSRDAVRAGGGVAALERVLACPSLAAAYVWAAHTSGLDISDCDAFAVMRATLKRRCQGIRCQSARCARARQAHCEPQYLC